MLERAIPLPGAMTPVERVLSRFDRDELASFIEVAIGLLDLADGDPDLEDSEASNTLVDARGRLLPEVYVSADQDEDCEPGEDAEPSLGSCTALDQTHWLASDRYGWVPYCDYEGEHDGRERLAHC